jgi:Zn-dependent protease
MEPTFEVMPPGAPPPRAPGPAPRTTAPGGFRGGLAALVILLAKFKTVLTMLLSVWVYSFAWGWPFAAGFVALIFLHEMGHVAAAKLEGIPVTAPTFIPFFGAMITMKQNPRDAWSEAVMAYGGPLAGGVASWICWLLAIEWQWPLLTAVAVAGFALNLFNLIPLSPLDGGRICAAVSRWFWLLGIALVGCAFFFFSFRGPSVIILVLVLYFGFTRLRQTFLLRNLPETQRYFGVPFARRVLMAALYLALIGMLLAGLAAALPSLQPPPAASSS